MDGDWYEERIGEIDDHFTLPNLSSMWPVIQGRYIAMGFNDKLSDAEMIEEYKYILEQYRKYVFSHQKTIMKHKDNLENMIDVISDLIEKAPEITESRKGLVYGTLRDDWLTDIYNTVAMTIASMEE